MRLAVVSDLHLGDSQSTVAYHSFDEGRIAVGARYGELVRAVRARCGEEPLDYLILLGDVLDFSVTSYVDAYEIGRVFFQRLQDDRLAREIVYVPGNHDFDLWPTVEYQVNIVNRFKKGKLPTSFRMSVPGIIDDRSGAGCLMLRGVTANSAPSLPHYGGLFLDDITTPPTVFNFAYPNVYLVTEQGSVLLTHGQYLTPFWAVSGRWAQETFTGALDLRDPKLLELRELVALNFPLSQLSCSVIGQAGPLTAVVQKLEHQIKQKELAELTVYMDRIGQEVARRLKGVRRWLLSLAYGLAKREVLERLRAGVGDSRYVADLTKDPRTRRLLADFYTSTVAEICALREQDGVDVPLPTTMIFGHTHQPIPWADPDAPRISLPQLPPGTPLTLYNTGGWLCHQESDGRLRFTGAEVFFYETGKGLSSQAIGYDPAARRGPAQ